MATMDCPYCQSFPQCRCIFGRREDYYLVAGPGPPDTQFKDKLAQFNTGQSKQSAEPYILAGPPNPQTPATTGLASALNRELSDQIHQGYMEQLREQLAAHRAHEEEKKQQEEINLETRARLREAEQQLAQAEIENLLPPDKCVRCTPEHPCYSSVCPQWKEDECERSEWADFHGDPDWYLGEGPRKPVPPPELRCVRDWVCGLGRTSHNR